MERIMTLDEEDIIRLVAKSVGVGIESVKLKVSLESRLSEEFIDEYNEEPTGVVDTDFKLYAKIELPVTQIDGTVVKDGEMFYASENDNEEADPDGTDC